jgi:hypothetical protein
MQRRQIIPSLAYLLAGTLPLFLSLEGLPVLFMVTIGLLVADAARMIPVAWAIALVAIVAHGV